MFADARLLVSGSISGVDNTKTGQTVTGTGNVLSTNTIDLSQNRDITEATELYLRTIVQTAVAGATSIEIQAIVADDAALTSNVLVIGSTGAIPVASLLAGKQFIANLNPQFGSVGKRYLGARYVITGTGSAGAFITDFGIQISDSAKFYPSAISVK